MMLNKTLCHCLRYNWPHRTGYGQCIWSPHNDDTKCTKCAKVCRIHLGKGSDCCHAPVVRNGEVCSKMEHPYIIPDCLTINKRTGIMPNTVPIVGHKGDNK